MARYIYVLVNRQYHDNDKFKVVADFQQFNVIPEEIETLTREYWDHIKKNNAFNNKYLVLFEVKPSLIQVQDDGSESFSIPSKESLIVFKCKSLEEDVPDEIIFKSTVSENEIIAENEEELERLDLEIIADRMIDLAVMACQNYLIFHKKVNFDEALKAFGRSNKKATAVVNSSRVANKSNSKMVLDMGSKRALNCLLQLTDNSSSITSKLKVLSKLLHTTNSTELRWFMAANLAEIKNSNIIRYSVKSIIERESKKIDTFREAFLKCQTALVSSSEKSSESEIKPQRRWLGRNSDSVLIAEEGRVPSSERRAHFSFSTVPSILQSNLSIHFERAISNYLLYRKKVNLQTALAKFEKNQYPQSFLFFYYERKGENRALAYLKNIRKLAGDEQNELVLMGALLQAENSKDLRFYIAYEILKHSNNHVMFRNVGFNTQEQREKLINSAYNILERKYKFYFDIEKEDIQGVNFDDGSKTFNDITKRLSTEIEKNPGLEVQKWLKKNVKIQNLFMNSPSIIY